ncbi:MAG: cobaltochelatase subunit CobN, partial [Leptolyngbyaceae cyanobacterium MO_188.B28]|nr:cobaltochelatase subunit CobN [Leptolyngbyaceae cyanobacterium MO_188.B28]
MHRLAAAPGGWNPDIEGVVFIQQTPAPLVILTAADTDVQSLAKVHSQLPPDFPQLRVTNLLQLQQALSIDIYAEEVLSQAQVIVLRLLGGRAYWSYGLEVIKETVEQTGASLITIPGDDRPDPELMSHSTVSLNIANQLWRYLTEGGLDNIRHGLEWICDRCLGAQYNPPPPHRIPRVDLYPIRDKAQVKGPKVGLLFYRAHYLAGNTAPIDALCDALAEKRLTPLPIFVSSLQNPEVQAELLSYLKPKDGDAIEVLLNTTSFSVAKLDAAAPNLSLWETLDVPILQVILSGGPQTQWETHPQGLSPRDIAMNIALPEVDGRIISRAVSFKAVQNRDANLETDIVGYEPKPDRIQLVADLTANWVNLRRTPPAERRIALILANYPSRNGRLANGVGLDTPASTVNTLKLLT